jgi:hypothetical protein
MERQAFDEYSPFPIVSQARTHESPLGQTRRSHRAPITSGPPLNFTIPFVFGGPVAGAWADRHDRKRIMIASNTVSGLTTVLRFILMLTGNIQLWMLEPLTSGVPRSTDIPREVGMSQRCQ